MDGTGEVPCVYSINTHIRVGLSSCRFKHD